MYTTVRAGMAIDICGRPLYKGNGGPTRYRWFVIYNNYTSIKNYIVRVTRRRPITVFTHALLAAVVAWAVRSGSRPSSALAGSASAPPPEAPPGHAPSPWPSPLPSRVQGPGRCWRSRWSRRAQRLPVPKPRGLNAIGPQAILGLGAEPRTGPSPRVLVRAVLVRGRETTRSIGPIL